MCINYLNIHDPIPSITKNDIISPIINTINSKKYP